MVRLSSKEIETLVDTAHQCFGSTSRIWLYGSRVDDKKKGGDIDLYIETDREKNIVASILEMRRLIWQTFGEQKIDILVRETSKKMSAMHTIAKESGYELTKPL